MTVPSSRHESQPFYFKAVQNGRSKASGINRIRLINNNLELDTAYPGTNPTNVHKGPTISIVQIWEEHSDSNDGGNKDTSKKRNNNCQVPNDQSSSRSARMPIRRINVRRVVPEAKALIRRLMYSSSTRTVAAAQETSVEALLSDGRCSDNYPLGNPDGTSKDIPF